MAGSDCRGVRTPRFRRPPGTTVCAALASVGIRRHHRAILALHQAASPVTSRRGDDWSVSCGVIRYACGKTDYGFSRGIFDAHAVDVAPGSRLADIAGCAYYSVNSRHHQAVQRLGKGLIVTAHAPEDGVIEALERHDRRFAVAVQWHPEDRVAGSEEDRRLFEAFAQSL